MDTRYRLGGVAGLLRPRHRPRPRNRGIAAHPPVAVGPGRPANARAGGPAANGGSPHRTAGHDADPRHQLFRGRRLGAASRRGDPQGAGPAGTGSSAPDAAGCGRAGSVHRRDSLECLRRTRNDERLDRRSGHRGIRERRDGDGGGRRWPRSPGPGSPFHRVAAARLARRPRRPVCRTDCQSVQPVAAARLARRGRRQPCRTDCQSVLPVAAG